MIRAGSPFGAWVRGYRSRTLAGHMGRRAPAVVIAVVSGDDESGNTVGKTAAAGNEEDTHD